MTSLRVLSAAFSVSLVAAVAAAPPARAWDEVRDARELTAENEYDLVNRSASNGEYQGWVKFVVFPPAAPGGAPAIWYQNSTLFPFHTDYLLTREEFRGLTRPQIDELTLRAAHRKAFVGTLLVKNLTPGDMSANGLPAADYQIVSLDPVEPAQVKAIQELLAKTAGATVGSLGYLPAPEILADAERRRAELEALGIKLSVSHPVGDLVAYTRGWTVGRVVRIRAADLPQAVSEGRIGPQDLLVVDEVPKELPPVAGVVTATPTAPSSHVVLLAQMSFGPVLYEKNAFEGERWKALEGKLVYLETIRDGSFQEARLADVDARSPEERALLLSLKAPEPAGHLRIDRDYREIRSLQGLGRDSQPRIGAKAANLAWMAGVLPPAALPERASAIPFHYYARYLAEARVPTGEPLGEFLRARLAEIASPETPRARVLSQLETIRDGFKKAAIPGSLLEELQQGLLKVFGDPALRIKLRSSSNAEDLSQFNGAGLYDSVGATLGDRASLERALNKVWRSLYSDRAYLIRRQYGIDEAEVAMACLVNPSFKGELANGVAISKMSGESLTATVTGFPGEELSVVHPPAGKLPETAVVDEYTTRFETLTTELPAGQTVLRPEEYRQLAQLMKQAHLAWVGGDPARAAVTQLDFEWKLMPSADDRGRRVVLKQVREVPVQPRFEGARELVVLGSPAVTLRPDLGEDDRGLLKLVSGLRADLELDLARMGAEPAALPIRRARLTLADGRTVDLAPGNGLQVEASRSDWELRQSWDGSRTEHRQTTWRIRLPHPTIASLTLVAQAEESRVAGERAIDRPVRSLADLGFHFEADAKDLVPYRQHPPKDAITGQPVSVVSWRARAQDPSVTELTRPLSPELVFDKPHRERFEGSGIAIAIDSKEQSAGDYTFIKTLFLQPERAEIRGVLRAPITVSRPEAMTYAPAHHNFTWQYAIDLFLADGITPEQKQELLARGGRYLLVGSDSPRGYGYARASLWSEDGASRDLDHALQVVGENRRPPEPGGGIFLASASAPASAQDRVQPRRGLLPRCWDWFRSLRRGKR